MVKIVTDLPPSAYQRIVDLVKSRDYDSVSQFVAAACENQLALDDSQAEPFPLPAAQDTPGLAESKGPLPARCAVRAGRATVRQRKAGAKPDQRGKAELDYSPERLAAALRAFRLPTLNGLPLSPEPTADFVEVWPWGQANRLFPLKIVVRALANLAGADGWPTIDEVFDQVREPAAVIGSALAALDEKAGRKRGELLSTALPQVGSLKSQDRFLGSFLCTVTPGGKFYPGGAFYYGLLSKMDGDRIGLTQSGLAFAGIANPILDGTLQAAHSTLSSEERDWLRVHVQSLPGEAHAFKTLLEALGNEELSPKDFAAKVAARIGEDPESGSFTIKFHGVVSRMIELGLIKRTWEGTRARYARNDYTSDNDQGVQR